MKKLIFLILLLTFNNSFAEKILEIGTGEWSPYVSQQLPGKGYFSNIVVKVFERAGYKVNLNFLPWKRAEILLEQGVFFGVFPYKETDERKEKFNFTTPIFQSRGVFIYNLKKFPNKINYEKFSDLKEYNIGAVKGYWYEQVFKEENLKASFVGTDERNIKKLILNRVDLVATEQSVGWTILSENVDNPKDDFAIVDKPLDVSDLRIMVSQKYPDSEKIIQEFNEEYKKFIKTTEYQDILKTYEKYGPSPVF